MPGHDKRDDGREYAAALPSRNDILVTQRGWSSQASVIHAIKRKSEFVQTLSLKCNCETFKSFSNDAAVHYKYITLLSFTAYNPAKIINSRGVCSFSPKIKMDRRDGQLFLFFFCSSKVIWSSMDGIMKQLHFRKLNRQTKSSMKNDQFVLRNKLVLGWKCSKAKVYIKQWQINSNSEHGCAHTANLTTN